MNTVAVLIKTFCEDFGYEFRDDYSGRSMYGKKCVGIVPDVTYMACLVQLVDYLRDEGVYNAYDLLGDPRVDSMGMDTIIYFPKIEIK